MKFSTKAYIFFKIFIIDCKDLKNIWKAGPKAIDASLKCFVYFILGDITMLVSLCTWQKHITSKISSTQQFVGQVEITMLIILLMIAIVMHTGHRLGKIKGYYQELSTREKIAITK